MRHGSTACATLWRAHRLERPRRSPSVPAEAPARPPLRPSRPPGVGERAAGARHLLLRDVRGARLTALFAPEHGLWGAPQDHATIATDRDPVTGMRVSSLYGERREPTPSMLAGLDVMVIDLQDVGSRYYTFAWTMALTMRACARAGVARHRARPAESAGRRDPRGQHPRPGVRLVRRPVPPADPPRAHDRRARPLPGARARLRVRADGGADAGLASTDALGGHGRSLGGAVAQHADAGHRARLSRRLSHRGHQPLGGPRNHATVRVDRRAVARCARRTRPR